MDGWPYKRCSGERTGRKTGMNLLPFHNSALRLANKSASQLLVLFLSSATVNAASRRSGAVLLSKENGIVHIAFLRNLERLFFLRNSSYDELGALSD